MNPRLHDDLEELSRLSVAEMLHDMAENLRRLADSPHLSKGQQEYVRKAERHIATAVDDWVDEVRGEEPESRAPRAESEAQTVGDPERGLECVLDMLAIYHDDIDESDFTPLQVQRLMIAVHNLMTIASHTASGQ